MILLFKQQNCVPSRAERYFRSEIITPKLVSLPVGRPGLLRNSICCQQPGPHYSETHFAASPTLGKRWKVLRTAMARSWGCSGAPRRICGCREGARRESLPARESNDDEVNPIDRNSFRGKAPDSGTCEFQVPSSEFQVPSSKFQLFLSGRFTEPVREGLQLGLLVHRPPRP